MLYLMDMGILLGIIGLVLLWKKHDPATSWAPLVFWCIVFRDPSIYCLHLVSQCG